MSLMVYLNKVIYKVLVGKMLVILKKIKNKNKNPRVGK